MISLRDLLRLEFLVKSVRFSYEFQMISLMLKTGTLVKNVRLSYEFRMISLRDLLRQEHFSFSKLLLLKASPFAAVSLKGSTFKLRLLILKMGLLADNCIYWPTIAFTDP